MTSSKDTLGGVGCVADLCDALGIVAPSLYAAYGSKAELFNWAMKRYVETDFLPLDDILTLDSKPAEALTKLSVRRLNNIPATISGGVRHAR